MPAGYTTYKFSYANERLNRRMTLDDCLVVRCPSCNRFAGLMCVHVSGPREGHVMSTVHSRRKREAAVFLLKKERRERQTAERKRRQGLATALQEFDRREYEAMKNWLRENGLLLVNANKGNNA